MFCRTMVTGAACISDVPSRHSAAVTMARMSPSLDRSSATTLLLANREHDIGTLLLAGLGAEGPAVADGVAQLDGVDGLGQADAVADVQPGRKVAAQHQRSLALHVRLDADLVDAYLAAESLPEDGAALRQQVIARGAGCRAALHGLQRTAGDDQRGDLRLRYRRLRIESQARRAQGAAHVHAGRDVGKLLLGAQIDARIANRPVVEDQAAALDVEQAPQRHVLAGGDVEFSEPAGGSRLVGAQFEIAAQRA